jgi:hypothetical protein
VDGAERLCACPQAPTATALRPSRRAAAENRRVPEQRANGVPRHDRNDDVRHKDSKNQQKSPTPSQFAWGAVLTCRTCGRRPGAKEFVHQKSSYKVQLYCSIAIPQPFQTCTSLAARRPQNRVEGHQGTRRRRGRLRADAQQASAMRCQQHHYVSRKRPLNRAFRIPAIKFPPPGTWSAPALEAPHDQGRATIASARLAIWP